MIREALARAGGVQMRAAEMLGLSERALRYKLNKYGLTSEDSPLKFPEACLLAYSQPGKAAFLCHLRKSDGVAHGAQGNPGWVTVLGLLGLSRMHSDPPRLTSPYMPWRMPIG
jgi:hypothetical protein